MKHAGFSIIEVILAVALFAVFSTGTVTLVLGGLDSNRLSAEQTIANQYAAEGLEAVRSIKNQSFAGLTNTTGTGLTQTGGVWTFAGTENAFEKYTRVITISDVYRETNGDIVTAGGTLDNDIKKAVSTVSWNVTAGRQNTVVQTTYLSDWKADITGTIASCNDYAIDQGYLSGTCRQNTNQCSNNDETYLSEGDVYCTGGPSADTCCAVPSPTPTPTPTITPTPTPITSCTQYCISLGFTAGTCRKNANACRKSGETYQSGGNPYCTGGNQADTCCCQ